MNLIEIPFVKKVGIQKTAAGKLELPYTHDVHNHLETIHASAQFALAETSSGEILQTLFPELADQIIPILRESKIKYKNPANKNISAFPSVSEEARTKFNEQFSKKGRALIPVEVEVRDADNAVTCIATFNWFIQHISPQTTE